MREKYCCLAGGWRLLLEWYERKTLLAGAGAEQQNRVIVANIKYPPIPSVKWRGGAKGPESHPRIDLGTTVRTDRDGG